MTSLLGYLVERSVRGQPQASPAAAPGPGNISRAETQGSEQSPDLSRGAIRPRIRNRHERRPEFNPPDGGGLTPMEETTERLQTRATTGEHMAEAAESGPVTADLDLQDGLRRSSEQQDASRTAAVSARRATAERAPARRPRSETQGPAERATAVDAQQSRPDRGDGNVRDTPPVARLKDRTPPARTVSEQAEPVQPAAIPIKAVPAAPLREPDPQEARPIGAVVRPRRQQTEEQPPAGAKSATAEQSRPVRQPLQNPQVMALQGAFERPAAPRIEVNIGRVEVRAVYAPPPPPRRAPSSPSMSLDDYLKQRDGAG
jgi:hypothetical protein